VPPRHVLQRSEDCGVSEEGTNVNEKVTLRVTMAAA
jgi:hypothetical protein